MSVLQLRSLTPAYMTHCSNNFLDSIPERVLVKLRRLNGPLIALPPYDLIVIGQGYFSDVIAQVTVPEGVPRGLALRRLAPPSKKSLKAKAAEVSQEECRAWKRKFARLVAQSLNVTSSASFTLTAAEFVAQSKIARTSSASHLCFCRKTSAPEVTLQLADRRAGFRTASDPEKPDYCPLDTKLEGASQGSFELTVKARAASGAGTAMTA